MNKKIRVLVVDDSAFNRQSIAAMLLSSPNIEVVDTVADGREAIRSVAIHKPDVITLDLEMPNMDGFTFLRWLMANTPTPVLVISSQSDTKSVFTALDLGAVDFLAKPTKKISNEIHNIKDDLLKKVEIIAGLPIEKIMSRVKIISDEKRHEKDVSKQVSEEKASQKIIASSDIDLVAIGSSTGGPPALQSIISILPESFPAAVAVSQHMPPGFTRYFAERMDKNAKVEVKEAEEGDLVNKGRVLISPGGYHMTFKRKDDSIKVNLKKRTVSDLYTPSVDIMMASASEVFGKRVLGIILTGMGNDGKKGMREIKNKNGQTIAESEETAVVFGMPGEAIKDGSIDMVLPLPKIAGEIIRRCIS
ncbi:MAG: chemotaxis response regulator protein-glutamate methylesterase [Nitrospirae bacterium]|nr:chemotaxis response regulator protein-glutamate methylesterase [Nitrospirota bacterium]